MALVILAPLFLTILAVSFIVLLSIFQITAADRVCKKEALKLQHELSDILKSLIKLNAHAARLRRQRDLAEIKVAAAIATGQPELIAEAMAFRRAVILEQEALALRQQQLLANATSERGSSTKSFISKGPTWGIQNPKAVYSMPLAVRPDPPTSITPDYVESANFAEHQSQTYHYRLNLFQRWPRWLQQHVLQTRVLKDLLIPFTTACSATLSPKEKNWKPTLKKVSLLSRW